MTLQPGKTYKLYKPAQPTPDGESVFPAEEFIVEILNMPDTVISCDGEEPTPQHLIDGFYCAKKEGRDRTYWLIKMVVDQCEVTEL